MPSRVLREAILDSEAVNALSVPAELFYRRLMSVVDDFGRFDARPSVLRSRCYPLRVSAVREADISRWLAECETAGLIALYSADAKQYLLFRKLGEPRAKFSKFPAPPAGTEDLRADANGCAHVRADVPGSNSGSESNSNKPPDPPLPFSSKAFAAAWADWEQHRKEKKQPLTPLAVRNQFKKLARIGEARAIAAIEHSIANGYQGIYEPDRKGRPDGTMRVVESAEQSAKRLAEMREYERAAQDPRAKEALAKLGEAWKIS